MPNTNNLINSYTSNRGTNTQSPSTTNSNANSLINSYTAGRPIQSSPFDQAPKSSGNYSKVSDINTEKAEKTEANDKESARKWLNEAKAELDRQFELTTYVTSDTTYDYSALEKAKKEYKEAKANAKKYGISAGNVASNAVKSGGTSAASDIMNALPTWAAAYAKSQSQAINPTNVVAETVTQALSKIPADYGKGNIDLNKRGVVENKDGTISTVDSFSVNIDGKEVLLPTVIKKDNKWQKVSQEEAIEHYKKTGEYLGKFDTVEEANQYAQELHLSQMGKYTNPIEKVLHHNQSFYNEEAVNKTLEPLYNISDELAAKSQGYYEKAIDSAANQTAGKVATDLIVCGTQLIGDAVASATVPGSGLALMGVRVFGGSAREARQQGATVEQQFMYGAAKAGIEVLTEKMFDAFAAIRGSGIADEAVEKWAQKLTETEQGKTALVALMKASGEGLEEAISDIAGVFADLIIDNEALINNLGEENIGDFLSNMAYDAFIGTLIGGIGQGFEIATDPTKKGTNAKWEDWENPDTPIPEKYTRKSYTEETEPDGLNNNRPNVVMQDDGTGYPQQTQADAQLTREQNEAQRKSAWRENKNNPSMMNIQNDIGPAIINKEVNLENYGMSYRITTYGDGNAILKITRSDGKIVEQTIPNGAEMTPNRLSSYVAEEIFNNLNTKRGGQGKPVGKIVDEPTYTPPNQTSDQFNGNGIHETGGNPYYEQTENVNNVNGDEPTIEISQKEYEDMQRKGSTWENKNKNGKGRINKVGETIRTSSVMPEERLTDLSRLIDEGKLSHAKVDLGKLASNAEKKINREGWLEAKSDWLSQVESGNVNEDTVSMGAVLLREAVNGGCTYSEFAEIVSAIDKLTHTAGSALYATQLLQSLTPEGKLYVLEKTLNSLNEELGAIAEEEKITIPEKMFDAFQACETDEQRNEIIDLMKRYIGDHKPKTKDGQFTAWRMLMMLGNFKTIERNVAGNASMFIVNQIKNGFKAGFEAIANIGKGDDAVRTTSINIVKKAKMRKDISSFFDNSQTLQRMSMGGKYNDIENKNSMKADIENYARENPFNTNSDNSLRNRFGVVANAYNKVTNFFLNEKPFGDAMWTKLNFVDALSGYLVANNISFEKFLDNFENNTKLAQNAVEYSLKQAQENTFRDTNLFSSLVVKAANGLTNIKNPKTGKPFKAVNAVTKVVVGGNLPFLKVPANILARGWEYSPLGLFNAVADAIEQNPQQVVEDLAKATTGTSLFIMGALLAKNGVAHSKSPDDDKERWDTLQGMQDYSVTIGDKNITLDWLAPTTIPFFMGAAFYEYSQLYGGLTADNLTKLASANFDPLIEASFLQGLRDNIEYAVDYGAGNFLLTSCLNYFLQGVTNTFVGQLEQGSEEYRQSYYTDKSSWLPSSVQKALSKAANKTPVIDYHNIDYVNAWGEKEGGVGYKNSLFNPAYVKDKQTDEISKFLNNLYNEIERANLVDGTQINASNIFPKSTFVNEVIDKKPLTPEEYESYAVDIGTFRREMLYDAIKGGAFKGLNAEQSSSLLTDIYSMAKQKAVDNLQQLRGDARNNDYYKLVEHIDTRGKDRTALSIGDVGKYVQFKSLYDYATPSKSPKDYEAVDKLVSDFFSFDDNLQTVLTERVSGLKKYTEVARYGIKSKTWDTVANSLLEIQTAEDTTGVGARRNFQAILESGNSPEEIEKLMKYAMDENSKMLSSTYRKTIDVLHNSFGFSYNDTFKFLYDSDWSATYNSDTKQYNGTPISDGKLSAREVYAGIQQLNISEAQGRALFDALAKSLRNEKSKRNDSNWYRTSRGQYIPYTWDYLATQKITNNRNVLTPETSYSNPLVKTTSSHVATNSAVANILSRY